MTASTLPSFNLARLGLFWFLAEQRLSARFVGLSRAYAKVGQSGGSFKLESTHSNAWRQLQNLDPPLNEFDFDFFPRGHVEASTERERWLFIADPKLCRGAFAAYVITHWNIPPQSVVVRRCSQYQSVACVGPPE
jgi:hypothetical protein